jgi:hypothetical protein
MKLKAVKHFVTLRFKGASTIEGGEVWFKVIYICLRTNASLIFYDVFKELACNKG